MYMLEWLYASSLVLLSLYGLNSLLLTVIFWFKPRKPTQPSSLTAISQLPPLVTIQLPIYNERYVVERLIGAVCRLDYPRERLQIQVLDDSTDDTSQLVDALAERMRLRGMNIEV